MNLTLDPEGLRTSMEMWRKALDMEIPLRPDLRIHFFNRRGSLLDGFSQVAKNWLTLLHGCDAEGEDKVELLALRTEIKAFKEWAEAGIVELDRLGEEEVRRDTTGR